MKQKIGAITLLVKDYNEAIKFYIEKLGFQLVEDTVLTEDKRWVLISPKGEDNTCLLLAKAATEAQLQSCGNQTGGRVFLFLHTDDFWKDYNRMNNNGIKFLEKPREEIYGHVVVFEDLYGNKWDLLEVVDCQ